MIKTCEANITQVRNESIDDLVMLEESRCGTVCAIHKSVNSRSGLPHPEHQMIQICPMPNHCCQQHNKVPSVRARGRRRSKSPPKESDSHELKSVFCSRQNWATTLTPQPCLCHSNDNRSINSDCVAVTCPSPNCPSRKRSSQNQHPSLQSASYVHVGKANSCPERTCSCVSKFSTNSASKATDRSYIQSESLLHGRNVGEIRSQIAQHIVCTDGAVTELKDEIEKVKFQLRRIHFNKADSPKSGNSQVRNDPQTLIIQLKTENKHLKRELIQKRKLQQASVKNVEKAKDIMSDYEKKVNLLHEQAMKSSKVMKQSKEKFCKCLQDKEALIKELQRNNESLKFGIREQALKYKDLKEMYEKLQESFDDNNGKCQTLSGDNQEYAQCIDLLQKQLECAQSETEKYRADIKRLEQELDDVKCNTCQKLEMKVKKQREKYENRLKENETNESMFKSQISILSNRIKEMESESITIEQLQERCNGLQQKLIENDQCVSKYKLLEDRCKRQCETMLHKEKRFEKERNEMRQLVDELTTVVKQNKVTLLQLSNINKQQEDLLESQCSLLSQKEEKLRMAESTIEILETKSSELENEVEELKRTLKGPCTKETCLTLTKELEEIKVALSQERDNQLMKQKIIEDQSQTICCLQCQIKEKMSELSKARDDTLRAEEEMMRINDDLARKHKDLENELDEKENLLDRMKKLEHQKTQLSYEMEELEKLLQRYCEAQEYDERQQTALLNLQKQLELQRREWEAQKDNLAVEKEKAVCAAKFATQKLLDTVSDFQKQVESQKKVQTMLTKMLHNKEQELRVIRSKMSSIHNITSDLKINVSMKEIYKRSKEFDLSNPTTQTSFYSSCSNCSKAAMRANQKPEQTDIQKLFYLLTSTDDEPIKRSH